MDFFPVVFLAEFFDGCKVGNYFSANGIVYIGKLIEYAHANLTTGGVFPEVCWPGIIALISSLRRISVSWSITAS